MYIEFWTRDFLVKRMEPFPGITVCNVGIGVGEWDNFLCDWLDGKGTLTSVDIDRDSCELFAHRQKREGGKGPRGT